MHGAAHTHSIASAATGLFRFFDEELIEYCVLGDVRGFPASIPDELEIVIDKRSHRALPSLLKSFCDRNQLFFVDRSAASSDVVRYTLSWTDREGRPQFLRLNMRSDYLRFGRRLWTAAELLRERVRAVEPALERCDVCAAPAAKEFMRSLLECIDRDSLTERDGDHLTRQWRLDPEGSAREVARFWDANREGGVIMRAAVANHWEPVRAARNALYASLQNALSPASGRNRVLQRFGSLARPPGMLIACLGPDGSGKAEVIEALTARPPAPFERGESMRLRPNVMRPPRPHDPQAKTRKPRGRLSAVAKLMMFAADYWIGYWTRIRPSLMRGTLLVSDSYFDDILVNPARYRLQRPRAFARLLAPWIPQPALWFVFDAPAHVLRERRSSEDTIDLDRMRGEYRRVLKGRKNVVVLDASQGIDGIIADAQRAIVAQTSRRNAQRLGLPVESIENPFSAKLLLFFSRRSAPLISRFVRAMFNSDIQCRIPSDIHLPHPYGVVIHAQAALGRRVTVMQQATISVREPDGGAAPIIGDDVYIGAGARVLGDVRIGDRVVIGANAVVTRDVPPGSTVVGANRIVAGRPTLAAKRTQDGSVARFPVGAHRAQR